MAPVAGLRAFGVKGPFWLLRGAWTPRAAAICSRGLAATRRPEDEPGLTSARQRDGIRSARGPCAGSWGQGSGEPGRAGAR